MQLVPLHSGAFAALRASAGAQWAAFEGVAGGMPRSDRRCLMLAAQLLANAIAGEATAREGVRHLQSAPIWDLTSDDGARLGLRKAVSDAWPKLQAALVAVFGATAVKAASNVAPHAHYTTKNVAGGSGGSGSKAKPAPAGLATLEGYAALCGAVQMNCVGVKVPSPVVGL
jgi:hypothetical protein